MSSAAPTDKSLGQLFHDLTDETRTLVRQEIALAKTELTGKASFIGRNAGLMGAGGLVILLGALPILAGIVISLGHKIGYATAAFLVGIVFVIAGAVVVMKAMNALKQEPLAPTETAAQMKETRQWAKDQVK